MAQLPPEGLVLAVNRVGPFDHLSVSSSLGRPATVVIPDDSCLRPIPGLRRTGWQGDVDSADHPSAVLARGHVLIVFPEGAAGNDGQVHKGHPEFAAAALASGAPIVPAALVPLSRPSLDALPPRSSVTQRLLPELRYLLRIGEPIGVERYADLDSPAETIDGFILRGLADQTMMQISQLAGRRYCDSYTGQPGQAPTVQDQPISGTPQSRPSRTERRIVEEQRRAAEAELARLLDEQEAARLAEAAEAARRHAEDAARADELARLLRRKRPPGGEARQG